jgi:serine O-acetyltransferase
VSPGRLRGLMDVIRWDWRVNPATSWDGLRARLLLAEVRCEQAIYRRTQRGGRLVWRAAWFLGRGLGSVWQWYLCGANIPGSATIGPGLRLPHPQNIIVAAGACLGEFCTLYQNVSLSRNGFLPVDAGSPRLGDRVLVGAGAVVIGDVTVGSGVLIGAGAVVARSVPARSRVTAPCEVAPRRQPDDPAEPGSRRHLRDPYSLWR